MVEYRLALDALCLSIVDFSLSTPGSSLARAPVGFKVWLRWTRSCNWSLEAVVFWSWKVLSVMGLEKKASDGLEEMARWCTRVGGG